MAARSLLSKWLVEYTSPVVVTVATAEAEAICLKNGLLFHELLSAFGHLDNMSASVRSVNHQIPVVDAHIRFERSTEVVPKSSGTIEQILRDSFSEYDINKLPRSPEDLKASPPTGWTSKIEQTLMRSMSFTEFEMSSHPLIFLTVVATSDVDHIACMHELSSTHHVPPCFGTGQYDPDVHRVYLLIHDISAGPSIDTNLLLRQMKSKFSPTHTKLLCINSLDENSPNLTHPDIWERWKIPLFFPQHAPIASVQATDGHGSNVVGSRLSMEDYMSLRNFCIDLFQQEILPAYERRVGMLLRHVNESKRGVKNVLKSFWRRPRDNSSHQKGVARYRYDRIEAQILLLADAAFSMRDYDAALSMYRLVRDDFKADKSNLHTAHTHLMMTACQFMMEPGQRNRELTAYVETITGCITANNELLHANAFYAFIMSEILVSNTGARAPLEAVQLLLQAAGTVSKLPMLSALMTEKAAHYCIMARQDRKYSLHVVLSGHKYISCGISSAENHASVCFAAAMVIHDAGVWGTVKSRLWRTLADKLKRTGTAEGTRKSLLLLLQILNAASSDGKTYSGNVALVDAVNVYHELIHDESWCNLHIPRGWDTMTTRDVLLDDRPFNLSEPKTSHAIDLENAVDLIDENRGVKDSTHNGAIPTTTVIEDLRIPEVFMDSVVLMVHLNGSASAVPHGTFSPIHAKMDLLKSLLEVEKSLELLKGQSVSEEMLLESCAEKFVFADMALRNGSESNRYGNVGSMGNSGNLALCIPLGESVVVQMTILNPLPVELSLRDFKIEMDVPESFETLGVDILLPSGSSKTISLVAMPLSVGTFRVASASWFLGDNIKIVQHINKKGPMQQKTLTQRAARERGPDTSLIFNIVQKAPSIRIELLENIINNDVLCGEIIKTTISLRNDGGMTARHIDVIFSHSVSAVEMIDAHQHSRVDHSPTHFIPFFGNSCTAIHLPPETIIPPGKHIKLHVYMRLTDVGKQEISLLTAYKTSVEDKTSRHSVTSFQINVMPAIDLNLSIVARQASPTAKSILVTAMNRIPTDDLANNYGIISPIHGDMNVPPAMAQSGDGCFCVTGILFLGGGAPSGDIVGTMNPSNKEKCVANTSESLSIFIPVNLLAGPEVAIQLKSHPPSSWILKLDDDGAAMQTILEKFTYISFCSHRLRNEMGKARVKIRQAELSGVDAQPRTISQVRKDRTMQRSNSEYVTEEKVTQDDDGTAETRSLLDVIINSEIRKGGATVAVAWLCHWRGQVHHGLSILHHQHLHKSTGLMNDSSSAVAPPPIRPKSTNSMVPILTLAGSSDFLSVGFQHPHKVEWDFSKGRCPVNVEVGLHSTSPTRTMLVSVEALEWIDISSARQNSTSPRRKRPPLKGLHWEGKSRFVDVELAPLATVRLPFLALISRRGVYDVKRFRVSMRFTDDSELVPPVIKVLQGQSLVAAVKSGSGLDEDDKEEV